MRQRRADQNKQTGGDASALNRDTTRDAYLTHESIGNSGGGGFGGVLSSAVLLPALLCVRTFSALTNTITDCDETFNFWEPTHYLLHNYGFQTWEYSPSYALRSYPYVMLHAAVAKFMGLFLSSGFGGLATSKVATFYGVRIVLGLACAVTEISFSRAIAQRFGIRVGELTLVMSLTAVGMFHASTAYLPASFGMYALMAVYAAWLRGNHERAVYIGVAAVVTGNWPFLGFLFIPLFIDTLAVHGLLGPISWGIKAGVIFLIPTVAADCVAYQRCPIAPAWNLLVYNAFAGDGGGSDLYGVEPASFYFKNVILNLNVIAVLAAPTALILVAQLLICICRGWGGANWACGVKDALKITGFFLPLFLWFGIMTSRPHKEERFLFPIYPLFCLAAAMTLDRFAALGAVLLPTRMMRLIVYAVLLGSATLSASRGGAVLTGYGAPLKIYAHVSKLQLEVPPATATITVGADNATAPVLARRLCVGQEWYRFPSSFFLPSAPDSNVRLEIEFLKSGFAGHLPAHFVPDTGTHSDGGPFNDRNVEEDSRYVPLASCDYVVDFNLNKRWTDNADPENKAVWEVLTSEPFLDASKSHPVFRAFWVPGISAKRNVYEDYLLLRNKKRI